MNQPDKTHAALVDAEVALTGAYAYIENVETSGIEMTGIDSTHVLVLIRVALAKVRSQLQS